MSDRRRLLTFSIVHFAATAAFALIVVALVKPVADQRPTSLTVGIAVAAALLLTLVATGLFVLLHRPVTLRRHRAERIVQHLFEHQCAVAFTLSPTAEGGDYAIIDGNRRARAIWSAQPGRSANRQLRQLFADGSGEAVLALLAQITRPGDAACLPEVRFSGGQYAVWRDVLAVKVAADRFYLLFDDASERERNFRELTEREALWRSIIDVQMPAVMIVDQDQNIRFVNRAAESLFGHRADTLIGAPFGYPVVQGEVAEIEIIRPGRNVAFAEMHAAPMSFEGKTQFVLTIQDVSARRRTEGDLRKLFQAIEQSPTSVIITDIEGRIEYVNPKFTEATGYTYAEIAGKNPRLLKSGYTTRQEYEALWRTIRGGHVWRGEFYNKRKDGRLIWERTSIAPVRDGRGQITHFVAVKEDVTDRKATEEKLRQAQKMEVIGQLTGGIAHDFNNLLAIILGNLQLLDERDGMDHEARELIADALWSAERGAQLTHRLLAFARRQRLHPKITSLNEVVAEMTELLRRTIGEKITVHEQLGADIWPVLVDRAQLESALLNLVINARDAMPAGGTLIISAENIVLPREGGPSLEDMPSGEYVELAVRDTGVGISEEVIDRIFEPFFTTKRFGEGSGLGLSMVYGFVHQSGGHISVDSAVGRGTAMLILLPRALPNETGEG